MAPKKEPIKPPKELRDRRVLVHEELTNTIEVPCDPHDPDVARWFDTGSGTQPRRAGNIVTALIDGVEGFAAMSAAIQTAATVDHYIYLLNWWVEDVLLDSATPSNGAPSANLFALLTHAVSKGVQVRAMFWDQLGTQNNVAVKAVSALTNGAAILDNNTLNTGSHHQKILVVKGSDGLVGFCGGIDMNADRTSTLARQTGSPMHDVHCRIAGPSAVDLLEIFTARWTDHPASAAIDKAKGPLRGVGEPVPPALGEQHVQIGRTYGNGSAHGGITNAKGERFYSFAKTGERTAERMIFHAIEKAERFIYVEDQYLVDMDASNRLKAQLPKIEKLVILVPHPSLSDHPHIWKMQKRFIDNIVDPKKVVVCYLKPAGAAPTPKAVAATTIHTYVHAKMWIVDDKFSIIGSANCGRRSYTHDSEVVAGIFDESKNTPCTLHFAHKLRMRLWAEHLNLKEAAVFDPIGSAAHWFTPALSAKVAVLDQNADKDDLNAFRNKFVTESQAEPFGG